ncbi:Uncharacterized protein XB16_1417 [Leptospira santarosai]|uniref:Uncharacterized protein n=1 Tax=Leptospira santarosai TaxID=28183 RepID=A0A2P1QS58_9LEPT|nr:Uncharacterized protein XB16_1417 [Leptospira santarosai]AVV80724.1 Uncharacterized protein XB15_02980 [Leptospira santarosai]
MASKLWKIVVCYEYYDFNFDGSLSGIFEMAYGKISW